MVRLEGVTEFFNNTYLTHAIICSPGRCATASADHEPYNEVQQSLQYQKQNYS